MKLLIEKLIFNILNLRRECDSHFTGSECWKKTYDYYTNHLIQSIVQFKNAINYVNYIFF